MRILRRELSNQIRVVMEPMENFVSVSIGVWIQAGSADETPENNGVAHVTEHMLFKGTKTRSAKEIADEMAAMGDYLDAYTSKECTCFYTRTLGEYAPKALEILADMVKNPRLDPEDLKKELGVILDEIDMYEDDAEELVHEILQKEIWKDHPLGYIISGEKETVRNFRTQDVRSFMDDFYTGKHILISVAGNFDPENLFAQIEDLFGDIPCGEKIKKVQAPRYRSVCVCRPKKIEQMHLDLAFDAIPYEHRDKYVLSIVNSLLGGNGNSRLFQEVREEKGLTYSIYSYGSSFRDCGLFQIYAAMAPAQTPKVLDATLEALFHMEEEGVKEKELELAKSQMRTELLLMQEDTHEQMEENAKAWLYDGQIETAEQMVSRVEEITADDITSFMRRYFRIENVSAAFVGNFEETDLQAVDEILKKWKIPLSCQEEEDEQV